jgi:LysM repeat protein
MRKILFGLFILAFTALLASAQDAATQQLIDEINGRIQNLTEMQATQGKKIAELEKQISDLSDKLNQPAVNNSASADDIKKLTKAIQEVDKKRQDDNDQIMKVLDKLAKGGGVPASPRKTTSVPPPANSSTANAGDKQNGYYYPVKKDETLIAIAKAYSAELKTKITVEQILAANPGLDPNKMPVGKKIFIPDPSAK